MLIAVGDQAHHLQQLPFPGPWAAATVFRDPLMISISDEEHSETNERWITMGQTANSKLLLVVHTYLEISADAASVRIISARPVTKHEQRQYEAEL